MGFNSMIAIFLLGFTMSSIVGPWGRVMTDLAGSGKNPGQLGCNPQPGPMELAQKNNTIEPEKKEPVPLPQKAEPEQVEPKTSTGLKEKPSKDFVPSEKIPADQAVDFPTDI